MPKKRRWAVVAILLSYLAIGLGTLWHCHPHNDIPVADSAAIAAFLDSLQFDSLQMRASELRYDSLRRAWQAEKLRRARLRQQHYDSAVHYWDSVYHRRDSIKAHRDSVYAQRKVHEPLCIDLATANADTLRRVPGIGVVLAQMIVDYRDRLGGFLSVRQVLEVEHVTEESLQYFTLSSTTVRRIDANRATLATLRRHPYINFNQAEAIYEARRKFRRVEGWHQLLRLPQFTVADTVRLAPYIAF